jgi:hypothetical protein
MKMKWNSFKDWEFYNFPRAVVFREKGFEGLRQYEIEEFKSLYKKKLKSLIAKI